MWKRYKYVGVIQWYRNCSFPIWRPPPPPPRGWAPNPPRGVFFFFKKIILRTEGARVFGAGGGAFSGCHPITQSLFVIVLKNQCSGSWAERFWASRIRIRDYLYRSGSGPWSFHRHRFDTNPDLDLTFDFDTNPDPDPTRVLHMF